MENTERTRRLTWIINCFHQNQYDQAGAVHIFLCCCETFETLCQSDQRPIPIYEQMQTVVALRNCIQTFENKILTEIVLHWLTTTAIDDMSLPSSIHAIQRLMDCIAHFSSDFTDDDCKRSIMAMIAYFFRLDSSRGHSLAATQDLLPSLNGSYAVSTNVNSFATSVGRPAHYRDSVATSDTQTNNSEYGDVDWKEISDNLNFALANLENQHFCLQFPPFSATLGLSPTAAPNLQNIDLPDTSMTSLAPLLSLNAHKLVDRTAMSSQPSTSLLMNAQDLDIIPESFVQPFRVPISTSLSSKGSSVQGLELLSDCALLSNTALSGIDRMARRLSASSALNTGGPLQVSTLQNLPPPCILGDEITVAENRPSDKISDKMEEVGIGQYNGSPSPRTRKRREAQTLAPSRTLRSHARPKSPLKPVFSGGVVKRPHGNLRPNVSYARIVSQGYSGKENARNSSA